MEIKHEFDDTINSQCRGCLSTGRKLTPIREYNVLFNKLLLIDSVYGIGTNTEHIQLCWECFYRLQRFSMFQQQVRKANEIFQMGQNYIFGPMSNLTTVIIQDTHPNIIYVSETNMQSEILKCNIDKNDNSNESVTSDHDANLNNEEKNLIVDVKIETIDKNYVKNTKREEVNMQTDYKLKKKTKKYKNKWAERRALLNKKPKYKILTHKDLVVDKYFRRDHIDVQIVQNCIKMKRDGYAFKRSRFKCDSCVVTFKYERLLMIHNDLFHEETIGDYICDICNTRMQQKKQLLQHIKSHTIRYECTLCRFSCNGKEKRLKHLIKAHKKVFMCLKCELPFSCKREFFKHYKDWHEHFICDHCGVSFKMRYCIEEHIKKQHSPFVCAPCDRRFSRYNGLWLHNKVCHGAPRRDGAPPNAAYCVECDKSFPDVYRYKWHLQNSVKHTPKKKVRIPCPDCGKVFSKNIYMKDHRNLVHLKNYKYRCEECDKNFVRNADLMKHKRRIHEGILPPRNKICYVCGRGFTTNEILTHHLRTHTGARPHRCGACPAAFAQRAALVAHRRAPHPPHLKHCQPHHQPYQENDQETDAR